MSITFRAAVESAYRRMFDFEGRSSRAEYWYFLLFYLVFAFVMGLFIDDDGPGLIVGVAAFVIGIANMIALIAVSVRRLHDIGKSGWWLFIGFIPIIGGLILLVWHCVRGDDGNNRFGLSPLQPDIRVEILD